PADHPQPITPSDHLRDRFGSPCSLALQTCQAIAERAEDGIQIGSRTLLAAAKCGLDHDRQPRWPSALWSRAPFRVLRRGPLALALPTLFRDVMAAHGRAPIPFDELSRRRLVRRLLVAHEFDRHLEGHVALLEEDQDVLTPSREGQVT